MDVNSLISLAENSGLTLVLSGLDVEVYGPKNVIQNLKPTLAGNKPQIVAELLARKASMPRVTLTAEDEQAVAWLVWMAEQIDSDTKADQWLHGEIRKAGLKTERHWDPKTGGMVQEQRHPWIPIHATVAKISRLLSDGTADQKRQALDMLAELKDAWTGPHSWRVTDYNNSGYPLPETL